MVTSATGVCGSLFMLPTRNQKAVKLEVPSCGHMSPRSPYLRVYHPLKTEPPNEGQMVRSWGHFKHK